MKNRLRLALPPLARIAEESEMAFALFDRSGRLLRSGTLPLNELAGALPPAEIQAILHPGDAIVVDIDLPPLPAGRLDAAVQARIEPMALSDVADLCVAHGPRSPEGRVTVAWAERKALLRAWRLLGEAGLRLSAIVPFSLAIPAGDPHPADPLSLPADARWQAPLPRWSLARPEWRPASTANRWRTAAWWAGAAALLWLLGLNLHAAQLRNEAQALEAAMEQAVRRAFPSLPVIIDPVKQARGQRDLLRLAGGTAADDDFMPLAAGAAKVLGFAEGHVASLHYENGELTLVLAEGYAPPANEAALQQAAAVQSLTLEKDRDAAHTWHVRRAGAPAKREARS
ncbi:type II secretion system protein GspL [Parapusillimonas granuli]|uniref:General secretion pathway protein GspL n=1 Tax=Parapusillimonas granuli TaxID=380911 RepID=A0A853G2Z1_9BURK|nr:type II secretion system protein GspL [Parapusillimonas granuli]MBB5214196.1 general secretion pathway protein L [Parapusillimonas granuli]MEB2399023.1 type II secretion system protein GspL [Alcaligenaceae bacterium]NYT50617.1 general secretion pathway protein GspL [Parapusillimonas granuli]